MQQRWSYYYPPSPYTSGWSRIDAAMKDGKKKGGRCDKVEIAPVKKKKRVAISTLLVSHRPPFCFKIKLKSAQRTGCRLPCRTGRLQAPGQDSATAGTCIPCVIQVCDSHQPHHSTSATVNQRRETHRETHREAHRDATQAFTD